MAIGIRTLIAALAVLASAAPGAARAQDGAGDPEPGPALHPARRGLLVIAAGRDSTRFRWAPAGEDGGRALVWSGGSLTLEPEAVTGEYGPADLTISYDRSLSGISSGRRLIFAEGIYPIDQPLLLKGDDFQLTVHRGELEITAGRIRYRDVERVDNRSRYLLLAGLVLLTVSLLARARSRLRAS